MDRKSPSRSGKDPDGPVLVWCAGHRCAALHRLSGGQDHDEQIRATIRQTSGGVLIESKCLGRCELAGVAAVARRDGRNGRIGPLAWFTGLENGACFAALLRWIASGGPRDRAVPNQGAPPVLGEAACGITPPPQVRRG